MGERDWGSAPGRQGPRSPPRPIDAVATIESSRIERKVKCDHDASFLLLEKATRTGDTAVSTQSGATPGRYRVAQPDAVSPVASVTAIGRAEASDKVHS